MCSLLGQHISFFISGDRAVPQCPVDIHCGSGAMQDTYSIPDVSGDGPVAAFLPVQGEDINGVSTLAEYFQETALYG